MEKKNCKFIAIYCPKNAHSWQQTCRTILLFLTFQQEKNYCKFIASYCQEKKACTWQQACRTLLIFLTFHRFSCVSIEPFRSFWFAGASCFKISCPFAKYSCSCFWSARSKNTWNTMNTYTELAIKNMTEMFQTCKKKRMISPFSLKCTHYTKNISHTNITYK